MAEADPKENTEDAAEETESKKGAKDGKSSDLFGGDDDLMDVFTNDREEVNEELIALTVGLDDIAIADLLTQAQDIRGILRER